MDGEGEKERILNIQVRVRAFMNTKLETPEVGTTVREAVKKTVQKEIGTVLITKEGSPVGIITERDILRRLVYPSDTLESAVEDVTSGPLVGVGTLATLGEAAELMVQKKIRRLPVKEGEKIVGIVTERDLQRALMEPFNALLLSYIGW